MVELRGGAGVAQLAKRLICKQAIVNLHFNLIPLSGVARKVTKLDRKVTEVTFLLPVTSVTPLSCALAARRDAQASA